MADRPHPGSNRPPWLTSLYFVPLRVWTPSSPLSCNFRRLRDDFDDDGAVGFDCASLSYRQDDFAKIRDNFDVDGQLHSIAPARSNPTARRRRNHLEFLQNHHNVMTRRRDRIQLPVVAEVSKSCMTKVTTVSTLSMGQKYTKDFSSSFQRVRKRSILNPRDDVRRQAVGGQGRRWHVDEAGRAAKERLRRLQLERRRSQPAAVELCTATVVVQVRHAAVRVDTAGL